MSIIIITFATFVKFNITLFHFASSLFLQILDAVNMSSDFDSVKEKVITVILPSYMNGQIGESGKSKSLQKVSQVEMVLHDIMPKVISSGDKEEVSTPTLVHNCTQ